MLTKVKLLSDKATLPERAHESDSGYDIRMIGIEKIVGDVIFFKTGLSIQPPKGHYYEVVPRSSISKLPLELANSVGIIDEHYRGEILIPVRITHADMGRENRSVSYPNGIVKIFGARPSTMSAVGSQVLVHKPVLFQMILRKRLNSDFKVVSELENTKRGDGGFGSTG